MNRILDRRGLADMDDGRIDLPDGEQIAENSENPLAKYEIHQLIRLLTQFSHTEMVERELQQRFGGRTVVIPVRLLDFINLEKCGVHV